MTTDLAVTARPWQEMAAILECPHCGGGLAQDDSRYTRIGCGSRFCSLLGIPDLRVPQEAALDYEPDWTLACSLAELYPRASFEDLVERLWQGRVREEIFSREHAYIQIGQIKRARLKHGEDLADTGWLGNLVPRDARARVDLGCGPGGFLLAAAATLGTRRVSTSP